MGGWINITAKRNEQNKKVIETFIFIFLSFHLANNKNELKLIQNKRTVRTYNILYNKYTFNEMIL